MKLQAVFFLVLASALVTKQESSSQNTSEVCQENAIGELKNNHMRRWYDRDYECYSTEHGMFYSGTQNVTKSGLACQQWIIDSPGRLDKQLDDCNFPERSIKDARNYCRNPTDADRGPWCYTTDPVTPMEPCAIKKCPENTLEFCQEKAIGELNKNHLDNWHKRDNTCLSTKRGMLYSGRQNVTKNGHTCQSWTTHFPNEVKKEAFKDCNFPERSREKAKNFCRNPTNSNGGPWCYTTTPGVPWEYCGIETCPEEITLEVCQVKAIGELNNNHREKWHERDNTCLSTERGMLYSGRQNVTINGNTCQAWITNSPNEVKREALKDCNYPERSRAEAKNYCRNPTDSKGGPWCYTTTPGVPWEYCAIDKCIVEIPLEVCQEKAIGELKNNHNENWLKKDNKCYSSPRGMSYSGEVNVTKSGRTCQAWISNFPPEVNKDALNDCNYPERSRAKARNYCRNPLNFDGGPWCYTTDPNEPWEYCVIKKCDDKKSGKCQAEAIGELNNEHLENWNERDNECYSTERGMHYSGKISVTVTGQICHSWRNNALYYLDKEALNDCNYPEKSLVAAENYCRNPTNSDKGPWCYTTEPYFHKERCAVKKCPK